MMLQNIFFYHEWIGGGNGTHETHYYITRGRVGARNKEKMLYGENDAYMCYEENEKKKTRKKEMAEITIEQR